MVLRVAGGVALRRDSGLATHVQMVRGQSQGLLEHLRRFDEGGRQAGFDVPFDVAVEQVDACMVG